MLLFIDLFIDREITRKLRDAMRSKYLEGKIINQPGKVVSNPSLRGLMTVWITGEIHFGDH